jgi:Leucine-rich repeat (LRR) protein
MIKDISKLASCQSLETVYAFGNQIKSIEALENAGITVYK